MTQLNFLSNKCARGQVSLQLLVFTTVIVTAATGFSLWAGSLQMTSLRDYHRTLAFQIAEAGVEYYRWHLAHAQNDYQDGTGHAGPYVHNYTDKDGEVLGTFTLSITPPSVGSNIVTIQSTGKVSADATLQKIIKVKLGLPSWVQYAVASNAFVRFGEGTEVFGPILSNGGIRFDGLAHNLVSSALTTSTDPDHSGAAEYAAHTHISPVDPLPPTTLPSRPDVFMTGRTLSVPALDFAGVSQTLLDMKSAAIAGGFYRASSTVQGYEVILKTNDTFDLNKVVTVKDPPRNCSNPGTTGWGTWSVNTTSSVGNFPFPANGLIFLEDHVWVRGAINGAHLTIAAGTFPDSPVTRKSITVNTNLTYTTYDGADSLGLVAQNNFNVGLYSDNNLRIDAAILAQNGRAGRYYYESDCGSNYTRNSLTLYGSIASNQRYGFAYTDGTGYDIRTITYDGALLFNPPPSYPSSGSQYTQISWEEVQ